MDFLILPLNLYVVLFSLSEDNLELMNYRKVPLQINHLEEDLYESYSILFSDLRKIQTTNGSFKSLVIGSSHGYVEGVGSEARFNQLTGFTQISPTEIIAVDQYSHCLRLVDRISQQSSVFVGNCTKGGYMDGEKAQFFRPYSVMVGDNRTLIVTEWGNKAVRSVDITTLNVTTLVPPGPYAFYGVVRHNVTGDLYLTFPHGIIRYEYTQGNIEIISGGTQSGNLDGTLTETRFNSPRGLTFLSADVLIIADQSNNMLRVLDLISNNSSSICSGIGGQKEGNLTSCQMSGPRTLQLIADRLYVGASERILVLRGKYSR